LAARISATLRIYLSAIAAGLVTAAVVHGIDAYLGHLKLPSDATILDDVLLGVMVAVLVLLLELHHQKELVQEQRKIALVREMNHHVRNALQTIVFATSTASDREIVEKVKEATERIEWTLREVLPSEHPNDPQNP